MCRFFYKNIKKQEGPGIVGYYATSRQRAKGPFQVTSRLLSIKDR